MTHSRKDFPADNALDGNAGTGWAIDGGDGKRLHRRAVFTLAEPLILKNGRDVTVRLGQEFGSHHTLGRFRVSLGNSISPMEPTEEDRRKNLDQKFSKWLEIEKKSVVEWQRLRPTQATSAVPDLIIQSDDSVFAAGDFTKSDTYQLKFRNIPAGVKAIRLEALTDERLPSRGPGAVFYEGADGDFKMVNFKVNVGTNSLSLKNATETFAAGGNNAAKSIDTDLQSGWTINGGQGRAQSAVFQLAEPLGPVDELEVELMFAHYYMASLGRFRISVTTEPDAKASSLPMEVYTALANYREEGEIKTLLTSEEAKKDREKLLRHFASVAPQLASERKAIEKLRGEMPTLPSTLVMRERPEGVTRATHRYDRGEFLAPKEQIEPGLPEVLPPLPKGAPKNRLGLVQWLVASENPLTARVVGKIAKWGAVHEALRWNSSFSLNLSFGETFHALFSFPPDSLELPL